MNRGASEVTPLAGWEKAFLDSFATISVLASVKVFLPALFPVVEGVSVIVLAAVFALAVYDIHNDTNRLRGVISQSEALTEKIG